MLLGKEKDNQKFIILWQSNDNSVLYNMWYYKIFIFEGILCN